MICSLNSPLNPGDGMDIAHVKEIQHNEIVRKRLAKLIALRCFRNTKLEDFHAGTYPDSQAGDYADVKVISPYGEIPWSRLARLSDDDMRTLMVDVVNRSYALTELFNSPSGDKIIESLKFRDELPRWNDPEVPR
jgi:ligand-binding SRPBCC domain-containing protein